jgi:hypothetical protein
MAKSYKQKLEDGIIAAHEAGDVEGAQVLADELMKWQPKKINPTEGMSTGEKFLAGVGKGFVDIGRGVGQRVGLVDQKDIDESRQLDAPLMDTTAGTVGNVAGQVAAFAPTAFIPGANTAVGATLIGAGTGALQPTATGESVGTNALYGAAGGFAGNRLGNYIGNKVSSKVAANATRKSQNATRDAVLRRGQSIGYAVPPSQSGAGVGSRLLEGLSGKYKTNQLAGIRNQNVTDDLVRQDLGLAPDSPINEEVLDSMRKSLSAPYKEIASLDAVKDSPANLFVGKNITKSGKQTIEALKDARFNSRQNWTYFNRSGDPDAYAKAIELDAVANQLEDDIELIAKQANKPGLLKDLQAARREIAKTFTVEKALKGERVDAKALARELKKGAPLSGNMKEIAKFADQFPDVTKVPASGDANPLTALDFFGGVGTSGMAMAGGVNPALGLVMPAARVGARYGILSGPYQRAFATPSYGSATLNALDKYRPALPYAGAIGGGLLGANYQ